MKRNIIRKNTSLNGILIERQIEIPDYDMTLLKISTMIPYLEGRKYIYGNRDGDVESPLDLSNYMIYDSISWYPDNTPKPETIILDRGFYLGHMKVKSNNTKSAALFYYDKNAVTFVRDISTNKIATVQDYDNPKDIELVENFQYVSVSYLIDSIEWITGSKVTHNNYNALLLEYPISIKGCIIYYDESEFAV